MLQSINFTELISNATNVVQNATEPVIFAETTTTAASTTSTTTTETTTTTTTTVATLVSSLEANTTLIPLFETQCQITKKLFTNLMSSLNTSRSLNRIHADLDLFDNHLTNISEKSPHRAWINMVQQVLTALNTTLAANNAEAASNESTILSRPVIMNDQAPLALNQTQTVANETKPMLANTTSLSQLVLSDIQKETDSEIQSTPGWNLMLRLMKYEYYRHFTDNERDSQDEEDSDEDDEDDKTYHYRGYNTYKTYYGSGSR